MKKRTITLSITRYKNIVLGSLCWAIILSISAQTHLNTQKPTVIKQPEAYITTIKLKDMEMIPATGKSHWKNGEVPNKLDMRDFSKNDSAEFDATFVDPVLQKKYSPEAAGNKGIEQNFEGISSTFNTFPLAPPDPNGDVGPNHYIQMVNLGFQVFDKSGTALTIPVDLATIWNNLPGPWSGNYGDPIVLYDELADRWFMSQFSIPNSAPPNYILIAVSASGDPLGSYHLYVYSFDNFPDYPKFGIWPDGYYLSVNQFAAGTWMGPGLVAFERNEILNGAIANMIMFTIPPEINFESYLPADFDGTPPPDGTPHYFASLNSSINSGLRLYEFNTDWLIPANSTLTGPTEIPTTFYNILYYTVPQPSGPYLDAIMDRLMYRLQYRNFGTYQTLVANHTLSIYDYPSRTGIRWYELRNTGSGWSLYQEGTYSPDANWRWMGSIAMNGNGDIALGYTVSSSTVYPSIRYTGRFASDPLGMMTVPEQTIIAGTASQTGPNRWGDYSSMSVDPVNNETFWFTHEYSTGGWNWRTRIAAFEIGLTANFEGNPSFIFFGGAVNFTDMSFGSPTSWQWNFPGGTPDSYNGPTPPPILYDFVGMYDVSLTVSNGTDADTETKLNYINVMNCAYCSAFSNNAADEWISNVTFNTISNSVNTNVGYEDFTSISTDVMPGSTYSASISCGSTGSWVEHYWVYIDWNPDCNLQGSGEAYDLGNASGINTLTQNITVPAGATPGATRMRVIIKYASDPTSCEEGFSYGQVEDYTINVLHDDLILNLVAMLEGPFNGSNMDLKLGALIPLNQPFNTSPWNYTGTESVSFIPNPNVVDWVLIDVRDAVSPANATGATSVAKQAAFILNDGSIVDLDGNSNLIFPVTIGQNLYVVLWQRNHIGILSNNALTPFGGVYSYDFSSGVNQVYGGANGHKELVPGVWGMISGDGNRNGSIEIGDKSPLWENEAGTKGYIFSDYNLDSESNNIDKDNFWLPNIGKGSQVPN